MSKAFVRLGVMTVLLSLCGLACVTEDDDFEPYLPEGATIEEPSSDTQGGGCNVDEFQACYDDCGEHCNCMKYCTDDCGTKMTCLL